MVLHHQRGHTLGDKYLEVTAAAAMAGAGPSRNASFRGDAATLLCPKSRETSKGEGPQDGEEGAAEGEPAAPTTPGTPAQQSRQGTPGSSKSKRSSRQGTPGRSKSPTKQVPAPRQGHGRPSSLPPLD